MDEINRECISVIVPAYNSEKTIQKCVLSICQQSYSNLQILIINDGSKDSTLDICTKLAASDNRIEIIDQDNKGVVKSIRSALEKVKGQYVGFVDSDDYIDSLMYETLKKSLDKNGADYVHSEFYSSDKNYRINPNVIDVEEDRDGFILNYILDINNRIIASRCTNLYRTEFVRRIYEINKCDYHWGEDSAVMIIGSFIVCRIAFVNDGFYHYSICDDSESRCYDLDKIKEVSAWYEEMKRVLGCFGASGEMYSKLDDYYRFHLSNIFKIIFSDRLANPKWFMGRLNELTNKRVAIYGAGNVGVDVFAYVRTSVKCEVVAWVDKGWNTKEQKYSLYVTSPDYLSQIDFDQVIIAVLDEAVRDEIARELVEKYKIATKKIIWKRPVPLCSS